MFFPVIFQTPGGKGKTLLIRLLDTGRAERECRENSPALQRWESHGSRKTKSRQGRKDRSAVPDGTLPVSPSFHPALKCWAIVGSLSEPVVVKQPDKQGKDYGI